MNISKNSWHYRLWMYCLTKSPLMQLILSNSKMCSTCVVDERDEYGWPIAAHREIHPPKNLCNYINVLPLMWLLFSAMTAFVALCIAMFVMLPFMDLFLDLWFGQMIGKLTLVAVGWVYLGVMVGSWLLVQRYKNSVHMPIFVKNTVEKSTPTYELIVNYVKDTHNKICRKLDFHDREEK